MVQEAYLEVWRNQHKLICISGFAAWFNTITYNVYKRWCRKQCKALSHEWELNETITTNPIAEYELNKDTLSDLLDKALAQPSPETRAIVLARYLEEQPQTKVVHDMGLSENAVAVRLHRGKLALCKILDNEQTDTGAFYHHNLSNIKTVMPLFYV